MQFAADLCVPILTQAARVTMTETHFSDELISLISSTGYHLSPFDWLINKPQQQHFIVLQSPDVTTQRDITE